MFVIGWGNDLAAQKKRSDVDVFIQSVGNEASLSGLIINIDKRDTLVALNPQTRLVPASVLKLVTTATALEVLGPQFRYHTAVYGVGTVVGSVLRGNIWVLGGGDPSLGSQTANGTSLTSLFDSVFQSLKKNGIDVVKGDLCIDDTFFGNLGQPPCRLWDDIGNYYGALPSALNYRDNSLELYLSSPALPDLPCVLLEVKPKVQTLFACTVKSSSVNRDSVYVYGVDGMERWLVTGKMPCAQQRFLVKAALPNPPLSFGNELKQFLNEHSIAIEGNVCIKPFVSTGAPKFDLVSVDSPALFELITVTNTFSNNLFADNLFLTIGEASESVNRWDMSRSKERDFWKDKFTGGVELSVWDGSGLSPKNLVTSSTIVDVLTHMKNSKNFGFYVNSLAVGGKTGTLKTMWASPQLLGKVFGKSGTMNGVVAYAGYFKNPKNEWCLFSIIVNNSLKSNQQVRNAIEKLVAGYVLG